MAKFFCDRIAIMYLGRIVEIGPAAEIFAEPRHPYTRALLDSIPDPAHAHGARRIVPRGEVPDTANPPRGCSFHPRCPAAIDRCGWEARDLRGLLERRWARLRDDAFESERSIIGRLDGLDASSVARLEAGAGRRGSDVASMLDSECQERSEDAIWRGVQDIEVDERGVTVRFADGVDPHLRAAGGVEVACVHFGDQGTDDASASAYREG